MSIVPVQLEFQDDAKNSTNPDAESDFDILCMLRRYRWPLIAAGLCGLCLGMAAYWKLGPEYEATTRIMVTKKAPVGLKDEETATWGDRREHVTLIMSPMIVNRAIEIGKLRELPSLRGSDDVAEDVLDALTVKRSSGQDRSFMNVLDIAYHSPSEKDAAIVVQAIVDAYDEYLKNTRLEYGDEMVNLISEANEDLLKDLKQKEREYAKFREEAPLLWNVPLGAQATLGQQATTNIHRERATAIETQRRENMLVIAELESRDETLREAIEQGASQEELDGMVRRFLNEGESANLLQNASGLTAFENRLLPLILEEQRLLRDFGPRHPDVQNARESIRTVLSLYRQQGVGLPEVPDINTGGDSFARDVNLVSVYRTAIQQQLGELRLRDRQLANMFDHATEKSKELARYQATDFAMSEDLSRAKQMWDLVYKRMTELSLTKNNSGYEMRQIAGVKAQWMLKRPLKFIMGGIAGCESLALAICYILALMDTTIRGSETYRERFHLSVLGEIPDFSSALSKSKRIAGEPDPALRYLHAPNSNEAESYRTVRTTLMVATEGEDRRILQVTSAEPNDGKSTLVGNLALAIAQTGKRVLLIDADLRLPRVHELFGLRCGIGLADVLHGDVRAETVLQETVMPRLSIMSAGSHVDSPSELLTSAVLPKLLRELKTDFDYVLLDTAPLAAVSDPAIIAKQVDGVLLVGRLGKNRIDTTRQAVSLLRDLGTPIVGVIANGSAASSGGSYDHYEEYRLNEAGNEQRHHLPTESRDVVEV